MREIELDDNDLGALSEKVLSGGGTLELRAKGCSMLPFIKNGDILIVSQHSNDELDVGSIILYRESKDNLIAHRIVACSKRDTELFYVRGDSETGNPAPISQDQVIGKVIEFKRGKNTVSCGSWLHKCGVYLWIKATPLSYSTYRVFKRIFT